MRALSDLTVYWSSTGVVNSASSTSASSSSPLIPPTSVPMYEIAVPAHASLPSSPSNWTLSSAPSPSTPSVSYSLYFSRALSTPAFGTTFDVKPVSLVSDFFEKLNVELSSHYRSSPFSGRENRSGAPTVGRRGCGDSYPSFKLTLVVNKWDSSVTGRPTLTYGWSYLLRGAIDAGNITMAHFGLDL
jgi:hypothetical protein